MSFSLPTLTDLTRIRPINAYILMVATALFLTLSANFTFFRQVTQIYPLQDNLLFVISIGVVLLGLLALLIALLSYRYTLKVVLVLLVMMAAVTSYFTDTYGTVYDTNMLQNALQTDGSEARDLLNPNFILRVLLLGVLPSFLILKTPVYFATFKKNAVQRLGFLLASVTLVALPIFGFSNAYASFFREHKPLRSYSNPAMPIYALGKLASIQYKKAAIPKETIYHAKDAVQASSSDERKPRLIVMVVGETAREDHVSLNGYDRNTFPQLSQVDNLTSFKQVTSCGTSTAYSVPCMFSYLGMDKYDVDTANYHENSLDTLGRLGINILWRDNNSDSKGVMDKLPQEYQQNYKTADNNPECDNPNQECRDTGMLIGLDDYVANTAQSRHKDTLIILHQMGNHGPAYYKRYDTAFEQFTPVCQNNDLAKCDTSHVINAYDDALLATDDFLAKTIAWLQQHQDSHEVAMLYVSDHGESLGENGVYLHGMPNTFAPAAQKHVPAFFWTASNTNIKAVSDSTALTHDAITPTLLKLFDVKAAIADNKPMFIQ